jgi:hypothetical protein
MKSGKELYHFGSTRSLVYSKVLLPEVMAILASDVISR